MVLSRKKTVKLKKENEFIKKNNDLSLLLLLSKNILPIGGSSYKIIKSSIQQIILSQNYVHGMWCNERRKNMRVEIR